MPTKKQDIGQCTFFFSLKSTLDHKHPLFILSEKIDRGLLERGLSPLYCPGNGCLAKPIRLMLKHSRNLSDESLEEQWSENTYYQYFCGAASFQPGVPCEVSEPVHFRHLIGETGANPVYPTRFKRDL